MAGDIEVKRYYWSEASTSATTSSVTIDAVTVANAFARPIGGGMSHGCIGTGSGNEDTKNFMAIPIVTGTTTVTVNLSPTRDVEVEGYFEVWEYVGSVGGPNEFVVLHHSEEDFTSVMGTSNTFTLDNTGSTAGDMVAILSGAGSDAFSNTDEFKNDRLNTRLECTSTSACTANRVDGVTTTQIGLTVIEFTGNNWTVNEESITHPASTAGSSTHTITSVTDWANTMYFWSYESGQGNAGSDDQTLLAYPGSGSATQFKTWFDVSLAQQSTGTLYTVYNADVVVEHNDTLDGDATTPLTAARPTTSITVPADHDLSTAVHFNGASTFNGSDSTSLGWIAWLSASNTFATDYATTNNDEDLEYAFQIIDMDALSGTSVAPAMNQYARRRRG